MSRELFFFVAKRKPKLNETKCKSVCPSFSCCILLSSLPSCHGAKITTIITSEKVLIYCHGNTDNFRHK